MAIRISNMHKYTNLNIFIDHIIYFSSFTNIDKYNCVNIYNYGVFSYLCIDTVIIMNFGSVYITCIAMNTV